MKTLNFGFPNHLHLSLHSIVSAPFTFAVPRIAHELFEVTFLIQLIARVGVLRTLNKN